MKRKALLVHDDVSLLGALRTELQRRQFLTLAARTAEDALDLFLGVAPDVVLLGEGLDRESAGSLGRELAAGGSLLRISDPPAPPADIAAEAFAMAEAAAAGFGQLVGRSASPAATQAPNTDSWDVIASAPRTPTAVLSAETGGGPPPLAGPSSPGSPSRPGEEDGRLDTLITDYLPSDAYEADTDESAVLTGLLEDPLYQTQVSAPAWQGGPRELGEDDDSLAGDYVPARQQLNTDFFDLAYGRIEAPREPAGPPTAPPSAPRPEVAGPLDEVPMPLEATRVLAALPRADDSERAAEPTAPAPVTIDVSRADADVAAQPREVRREPVTAPPPSYTARLSVVPPPVRQPDELPAGGRPGSFTTPVLAVRTAADQLRTGSDAQGFRGGSILLINERAVEHGDVALLPFPKLLVSAHFSRVDGVLRLTRGGVEKAISFARGDPIFASSNDPSDRLSELLYREGRLTRVQNENARLAAAGHRRAGAVLLDMGYLKEEELVPAVTRQLQAILFSLFEWRGGSFRFLPGDPPLEERITLSTPVPELLMEGVRRKHTLDRLRDLVRSDAVPTTRGAVGPLSRQLGLQEAEAGLLAAVDGRRSVASLLRHAGLREVAGLRVLYAAHVLDGIELRRAPPVEEDTKPLTLDPRELYALAESAEGTDPSAPPAESVAEPAEEPPPVVRPDIDRDRVLAKHAQVRTGNYFEILGIRADATDYEVGQAYEQLAATFNPAAYAGPAYESFRAEVEEIAAVLQDAVEVLRDERRRAAYAGAITPAD